MSDDLEGTWSCRKKSCSREIRGRGSRVSSFTLGHNAVNVIHDKHGYGSSEKCLTPCICVI